MNKREDFVFIDKQKKKSESERWQEWKLSPTMLGGES